MLLVFVLLRYHIKEPSKFWTDGQNKYLRHVFIKKIKIKTEQIKKTYKTYKIFLKSIDSRYYKILEKITFFSFAFFTMV